MLATPPETVQFAIFTRSIVHLSVSFCLPRAVFFCSYESPAGFDPQGYGGAGGMPNYPGYGPGGAAGPSPQGPPPMMPFSSPMGPAGNYSYTAQ